MSAIGWRFAKRSRDDVEHDPTEADQFNSEDVQLEQALVREAAQNSQDASRSEIIPVRTRFAIVRGGNLDDSLLREITAGTLPHFRASRFDRQIVPDCVLVVEDFGTTGLVGDAFDDRDEGPFRSFWFRHGRSFKTGGKLGRWGLGKLVFPLSSTIRSHFGLTVREGSEEGLLLGQSVLRTHELDGVKHAPHGHWGLVDEEGVRPVTDPEFLRRFQAGFDLRRGVQPGLSVVVPWPSVELNADKFTEFVVVNYAFPILTRRLVVDGPGGVVDSDTVRELGQRLLPPGLIDFIDRVNDLEEDQILTIPSPRDAAFSELEADFDPDRLHTMRERYASGELVSMRVPLKVQRKGATRPESTSVEVHLRAAQEGQRGAALCARGDITVPGEADAFRADTHFALLRAREPLISEFLGDAENPAHTKWSHNAERFAANWTGSPAQRLRVVRYSVSALHRLLATGEPRKDETALLNFFWLEDPSSGSDNPRIGRKKKPVITVRPEPVPPAKRRLNLTQTAGGFTVSAGPDFRELALPVSLEVKVAYDVERGDPIKLWEPYDFDLAEDHPVSVAVNGAAITATGQCITLEINEPQFRLHVSGFDEKRDVVVKMGRARESDDHAPET